MKPLRILVADDHELFRDGMRSLLQSHEGWEIRGEVSTGGLIIGGQNEQQCEF